MPPDTSPADRLVQQAKPGEQACHELRSTDHGIKDIAYSLGFRAEFYFFRRFRQIHRTLVGRILPPDDAVTHRPHPRRDREGRCSNIPLRLHASRLRAGSPFPDPMH